MSPSLVISPALSVDDVEHARELMRRYAAWTGIDLCFQNFEVSSLRFPESMSRRWADCGLPVSPCALHQLASSRCVPLSDWCVI